MLSFVYFGSVLGGLEPGLVRNSFVLQILTLWLHSSQSTGKEPEISSFRIYLQATRYYIERKLQTIINHSTAEEHLSLYHACQDPKDFWKTEMCLCSTLSEGPRRITTWLLWGSAAKPF